MVRTKHIEKGCSRTLSHCTSDRSATFDGVALEIYNVAIRFQIGDAPAISATTAGHTLTVKENGCMAPRLITTSLKSKHPDSGP